MLNEKHTENEQQKPTAFKKGREQGFRKTEIGPIPNDWEIKLISEIFIFLTNASNPRSDLSQEGDIKYIHYGDIHTKYPLLLDCDKDDIPFIEKSKLKNLTLIKEGDIIMADASEDFAGIGLTVEAKNIKDNKVIAGLHTFLMRDQSNVYCNGFKAYLTSIETVKKAFQSIATGISVYGISKKNIAKLSLPIPPLPEQKAIAQALSDVDDLISALDALIEKKRNIKQGTMQELLTGKRRLPGFSGEWETTTLRNIAHFDNGQAHERHIAPTGNYILVNSKFISTAGNVYKCADRCLSPLNKNDIVMVMSDVPNGRALAKCYLIPQNDKYTLNQRICKIQATNCYYMYLYFILDRNKYFLSFDSGSGQTNLRKNEVLDCPLYMPNIEEQTEIAKAIHAMNTEIEKLEQQRNKTKLLKQGMMQELLTGKMRLI